MVKNKSIESAREKAKKAEMNTDELAAALVELEAAFAEAEALHKVAIEDAVSEADERARKQRKKARDEYALLEDEATELKAEVARLANTGKTLQMNLDKANKKIQQHEKKIAALENELKI